MSWMETARELEPDLQKGDLKKCINVVKDIIKSSPATPFHLCLEVDFTNDPKETAQIFDEYIKAEFKRIDLKAIYTETNGFDINPDEWFYDIFSYKKYGGKSDLDWLSRWNGNREPSITLTGMEELQKVYASDAFQNPDFSDISYYSSLLVVLKFQALIKRSLDTLSTIPVPVFATSHEYDFIYEYKK